jgi:hypothetical protein
MKLNFEPQLAHLIFTAPGPRGPDKKFSELQSGHFNLSPISIRQDLFNSRSIIFSPDKKEGAF